MPSKESSAEHYQRLKVGNLESSKRDHFRPDPVPFDRPLTQFQLLLFDKQRWNINRGINNGTRLIEQIGLLNQPLGNHSLARLIVETFGRRDAGYRIQPVSVS